MSPHGAAHDPRTEGRLARTRRYGWGPRGTPRGPRGREEDRGGSEAAPDHWERLPRVVAALAFHSAEPNPVAIEALEALRRQPSVTPDYSTGGFSL